MIISCTNKIKGKRVPVLTASIVLVLLIVSVNFSILYALDSSFEKNKTSECPPLMTLIRPYLSVFEDLGIEPNTEVIPNSYYEVLGKLRDNDNNYLQVW
ncbi:MAG: hypothetical protein ACFFAU_19275, partial [Candidatus Hodarchaeota archaeon]